MSFNRREFIKIAGLAGLVGLGGRAAFDLLAPGQAEAEIKSLPLTQGKKWGLVFDMTKMNEEIMEACIKTCHSTHNVPEWGDPRVEIKWLWKETYEHSFPELHHDYVDDNYHRRNFLILCNHCTKPPCCRVCPTKATWKRKADGVVMMDLHRCIGCRFCMAACPYGARSFNYGDPLAAPKKLNSRFPHNKDYPRRSKGVVEKCTFCDQRLARGQYPACVETANEMMPQAMIFGDLDNEKSEIRKALRENYTIRRKPELGTGPNIYYII